MRSLAVTALAVVLVQVTGCDRVAPSAIEAIRARHELRVVTLDQPTCYYIGAQGAEGLEFELASAYATRLNVRLNMYTVANESAMRAELAAGRADIAAAALSNTPEWSAVGDAAEPYAIVPQLVVYLRSGVQPRDTLQLESAKLVVRAGSPQERILLKLRNTVAPGLKWAETAPSSADPVEDVDTGDADYAIIDAREFSFAHHLYPDVQVGFALPEARPLQWIVRRDSPELLASVNAFFHDLADSGRIVQLLEKSSGDARRFAYEESLEFQTHVSDRLPQYRNWFEQAAAQSGLDWRLLAAIGYQESKWDPRAASGTGALGIMMLTARTAQGLGIKNRTNPEESIFAGARYLAQVRAMIPERVLEPDRTWFTLAAYNVGFGHLEDARILTQASGKNPDSWEDVRKRLPLLAQDRYAERARRGYARGWEPVQYVDRIQRFLKLLEWESSESGTPPATTSNPTTMARAPGVHTGSPGVLP